MEVEVRFTVPLKSVAEIPVAAGFPPRAYYALPHRERTIVVSLLHLNLSQEKNIF